MQSTADRSKPRIRAEDSRYLSNRSPFFQNVRMLARYSARMNAILKPAGLDVPKWRVLMLLAEERPITISQIADEAVGDVVRHRDRYGGQDEAEFGELLFRRHCESSSWGLHRHSFVTPDRRDGKPPNQLVLPRAKGSSQQLRS